MPAKSAAQLRFMAGVASGNIKAPGLSKAQASEYVHATPKGANLPEHVHPHHKQTTQRGRGK